MEKVCFVLQIKPGCAEDYAAKHASAWPEMRDALKLSGWHNYSLFIRPDGLVVGYFETHDFDQALRSMEALEVNTKWQATIEPLLANSDGRPPDQQLETLAKVFDLDENARNALREESPLIPGKLNDQHI